MLKFFKLSMNFMNLELIQLIFGKLYLYSIFNLLIIN